MDLDLNVNGDMRRVSVEGSESAVDVIRDGLGLTGTKLVCEGGVCGACTVLQDGRPVAACLTPATSLRNAEITTIEGLGGPDGELHPVQRAFLAHDGLQCGYCTPGFVVDAAAFFDRWRAEHGTAEPDRHTIADALAGHLCRCGAYEGIFRAVAAACRGEHEEESAQSARIDGRDKVTGAARYTADVQLPDMLHAAFRRSDIAAAHVESVDLTSADFAIEVLPVDRRIRYAGQPIAVVAAQSLLEAQRLAAQLPINITPLPFVLDPEQAKLPDAPSVYENRRARKMAPNAAEGPMAPAPWKANIRKTNRVPYRAGAARRRIKKARNSASAALAELQFSTAPQMHTSFEPHACVADWSDPNLLRAWVSTQAVEHVAHELAKQFKISPDQVEVISDFVGGGFGSKLGLTVEIRAAVELSRLARRPVKLILDRREELTATGNRPGMSAEVSLLATESGDHVRAIEMNVESHAGVSVNNLVGVLGMLVYERTPRYASDFDIVTNGPPATPFRGPGGPLYCWALEQTVDQVAHQLDIDPIQLRRNWDGNPKRQALYDWAQELAVWKDRPTTGSATGRLRRGVGIAGSNWMYFVDPDTEVSVRVEAGRLVVCTATQDMGTGSKTVLANAVAKVFKVAPSTIHVEVGTASGATPHGPTSGGSRTTVSIWSTALEAAEKLKSLIGDSSVESAEGKTASAKRGGDRGLRAMPVTMSNVQVGRGFSAAVHVSEVEVDTHTGKTRVLSVHGGVAVGTIHTPMLARSQCEGSIIQGVGLALYEQQVLDPHTGLTLTSNLEDYRIPQLGDTPEITIHFHQDGWDRVPGGGVGLGEVATMSPAASIGNAVFNATGWRPTSLPIRPDRIVEALR